MPPVPGFTEVEITIILDDGYIAQLCSLLKLLCVLVVSGELSVILLVGVSFFDVELIVGHPSHLGRWGQIYTEDMLLTWARTLECSEGDIWMIRHYACPDIPIRVHYIICRYIVGERRLCPILPCGGVDQAGTASSNLGLHTRLALSCIWQEARETSGWLVPCVSRLLLLLSKLPPWY